MSVLAGQKEFGTKTEVKNVNSFRFIREALEYEIDRQIGVIESGEKITQETRLYNSNEGKTYSMRSKEQAHDYRYFPEPDLLPLIVDEKWQAEIRASLPELPEARRKRMVADYGITEYDAQVLTFTKALADQFEAAAKAAKNPKRVANLVQSELMGRLKAKGLADRAFTDFNEGCSAVSRFGGERDNLRKDAEGPLRSQLRA